MTPGSKLSSFSKVVITDKSVLTGTFIQPFPPSTSFGHWVLIGT